MDGFESNLKDNLPNPRLEVWDSFSQIGPQIAVKICVRRNFWGKKNINWKAGLWTWYTKRNLRNLILEGLFIPRLI